MDTVLLMRNGFNGSYDMKREETAIQKERTYFTITYFGAISAWFDFDIIRRSLEDFGNIRYKFIGPWDTKEVLADERIEYCGQVDHSDLHKYIQDADIFIMPFVMNKLIESVDPIKIYEYIYFNRNIVTVYYDEISRFEPFVYFYKDYDEYRERIQELLMDNTIKYKPILREHFLMENDWEHRAAEIFAVLDKDIRNRY